MVPALAVEDNYAVAGKRRIISYHFIDLRNNAVLDLSPFGVIVGHRLSDFNRLVVVLREEQADGSARRAEPADGVYARHKGEGHPARCQGLVAYSRGLDERTDSRAVGVLDPLQSALYKYAVLTAQINYVAYRAEAENIGVVVEQHIGVAVIALERHNQLEYNPDAR